MYRFLSCLFLTIFTCTWLSAAEPEYRFRKLLVAESVEAAAALDLDSGGNSVAFVTGVEALQTEEFRAAVAPLVGRPIGTALLNEVIQIVTAECRKNDRYLVDVKFPKQNITAGVLRIACIIGRYSDLTIQGNKWFSTRLLEQKLGIQPGDEVRMSVLEEAVNWANTNPFRHVQAFVQQQPDDKGKANLVVNVREARPIRFGAGYNNGGVPILGRNQYSASVQLGNLWQQDHQASYQYLQTDDAKLLQGHVFSYSVPLPWRHHAELSGSYVEANPQLEGGLIGQTAESFTITGRYRIPLSRAPNSSELFFGFDFKESNNNLAYGGSDISSSKIHIYELVAGYAGSKRDKRGAWAYGATINLSPGDLDARNTDKAFRPDFSADSFRTGRLRAKAQYATATAYLQRLQKLPHGWELFSRALVQGATANLPSNLQLTIGGAQTVRGFNPNVHGGEFGFVFNNDLQTPPWKTTLAFLPENRNILTTRFTFFYDAGRTYFAERIPIRNTRGEVLGTDEDAMQFIASVGAGVRMSVANNLSLTFDYGVPVTHSRPPIDVGGQGHIRVLLTF